MSKYDHMIPALYTPKDLQDHLADRLKQARLTQNLTQQALAERSGVSLGSLRRFEQRGLISLTGFVKLSFALNLSDPLWRDGDPSAEPQSMQALMAIAKAVNAGQTAKEASPPKRQRARAKKKTTHASKRSAT